MITYQRYFTDFRRTNKNSSVKTVLEAKLRFKDEAKRQDIINKFYGKVYGKNQEPGLLSEYPLDDYLDKTEKIIHNPLNCQYLEGNSAKKREIIIKKRPFRLGLDIKVSSCTNLKPEDMLNLEDLNWFILTGQYPKKQ